MTRSLPGPQPHRPSRRQLLRTAVGSALAAPLLASFAGCGEPGRRDDRRTGRSHGNGVPLANVRVRSAEVRFIDRELSPPLQLSTGPITSITEARVQVAVEVGNREAVGMGNVYLSDLWSWPDPDIPHEHRDAALRELTEQFAANLYDLCGGEPAHPLELGLRLHRAATGEDDPPVLARALCASPFDAAIHDAVGHALERSSFTFYDRPYPIPGADAEFRGGACRAIGRIIRSPVNELPAWWIVGAGDSMDEDVRPAVERGGYRCFKLKLLGRDPEADADRTSEVYQAVRSMGVDRPRLLGDSNESNPDLQSVIDYLERLKREDPDAYAALDYLEQPTGRDIEQQAYDWRPVTAMKPALLDEGLIHPRLNDFELFQKAYEQHWSGFALKTCKGHSFALLAAAWARDRDLMLSMQDLTNPGYSAIHAALFCAYVPMINGVEINSPQFTPDANEEWLPRLSGLFEPRHGVHRLDFDMPPGLGSDL